MKTISLWSGGKDSCLACYKAIKLGYKVISLFNFTNINRTHSLSHGLPSRLLRKQVELTEMPFLQKAMSKETYRHEFINLITDYKVKEGIQGIIFGDIYLEEHKDWIDKVCRELEVKAIMPLWGKDTKKLIKEFIRLGFEAIVVSTRADLLTKDWLGRKIDKDFIKTLKPGVDPCGENGEFHTFVINGPLFKKQIEVTKSRKTLKDGRWFLEILDWKIV